jgi:hypothetical protein
MFVWFCPVEEPGVYVIVRPDPSTTVVCLSDGLTVEQVTQAAAQLATIEERNWVRKRLGYPSVKEDPTYAVVDKHTRGKVLWDRSMIPPDLLWTGEMPRGKHSQAAQWQVAGDGLTA